MILMPTPSRDLLARLLDEGVVHDKKEDIPDPNPQPLEELMQGGFRNLLHGPDILSQESSETGEGSVQKRKAKGLNHGGRVGFFTQLDKADDKRGEDFERKS
jgi:hypothetical protein